MSDGDIANLIAFLQTLEDDLDEFLPQIVPESVPSGLPVAALYKQE